jgi:hypothetical protein
MLNRICTIIGEPLTRFLLRHESNPPVWLGIGATLGAGFVLLMIASDQFLR